MVVNDVKGERRKNWRVKLKWEDPFEKGSRGLSFLIKKK
jgi:hypothetical protein